MFPEPVQRSLVVMLALLLPYTAVHAETPPATGGWRLAKESSPYLRLHADNPVAWHPWGEAAFAKARLENKPVFESERKIV